MSSNSVVVIFRTRVLVHCPESGSRETAAETVNSSQHGVFTAKPKRSEFFVSEHSGKLHGLQICVTVFF